MLKYVSIVLFFFCTVTLVFAQDLYNDVQEIDMPGYVFANDTPHVLAYLERYPEAPDVMADKGQLHLPTLAVALKHHEMARLFFEHGANINARSYGAVTPLMAACVSNDAEMVAYLLDHGAKIDTNGAPCALSLACAHADTALIELLLDRGASCAFPYGDLGGAALCSRMNLDDEATLYLLKRFIENGLEMDALDFYGYPVYVRAARAGKIQTLRYMLENGANVPYELQAPFLYECSLMADTAVYTYLQTLDYEPDSFSYTPLEPLKEPNLEELMAVERFRTRFNQAYLQRQVGRIDARTNRAEVTINADGTPAVDFKNTTYRERYPAGSDATELIEEALAVGDAEALLYALDSCRYRNEPRTFFNFTAKPNVRTAQILSERGLMLFGEMTPFTEGHYNVARYMLDNGGTPATTAYACGRMLKNVMASGNYQMFKLTYKAIQSSSNEEVADYFIYACASSNVNILKFLAANGHDKFCDNDLLNQAVLIFASYDTLAYAEEKGLRLNPDKPLNGTRAFLTRALQSDDLFNLFMRIGGSISLAARDESDGVFYHELNGFPVAVSTRGLVPQPVGTRTPKKKTALNTAGFPLLEIMDEHLNLYYYVMRTIRAGAPVTEINPDGISPQSLFFERKDSLNPFTRHAYARYF